MRGSRNAVCGVQTTYDEVLSGSRFLYHLALFLQLVSTSILSCLPCLLQCSDIFDEILHIGSIGSQFPSGCRGTGEVPTDPLKYALKPFTPLYFKVERGGDIGGACPFHPEPRDQQENVPNHDQSYDSS